MNHLQSQQNFVLSENNSVLISSEGINDIEGVSVEMFNSFTSQISNEKIINLVNKYLDLTKNCDKKVMLTHIVNLFRFTFLIRDCRGQLGRGFRDIFKCIFVRLYKQFPNITLDLVKFIPEFGYWKDIISLIDVTFNNNNTKFTDFLVNIVIEKRKQDLENLKNKKYRDISLLAKYLPKETGKFKTIAQHFAKLCYKKDGDTCSETKYFMQYRKDNSKLNKIINTVEIDMCRIAYDEIDYSKVPSRALYNYSKAFANFSKSDDPRRIYGCEKYLKFLSDVKNKKESSKGCKLWPHLIGSKLMKDNLCEEEILLYGCQLDDWIEKMTTIMSNGNDDFLRMINLTDVSYSMEGTPINVAITMSYIFARAIANVELQQTNKVLWGNKLIIFSSVPIWFTIDTSKSHSENLRDIKNSKWSGQGTDYIKVHEMILTHAYNNGFSDYEMPKTFITWSDMQFDEANVFSGKAGWSSYPFIIDTLNGSNLIDNIEKNKCNENLSFRQTFVTHHEILKYTYEKLGYKFPVNIYWNLRGDTFGQVVNSNEIDTCMLSGFTPSNISSIFEGELINSLTPYKLFEKSIKDSRYDCIEENIRNFVKNSTNLTSSEEKMKESTSLWNIFSFGIA